MLTPVLAVLALGVCPSSGPTVDDLHVSFVVFHEAKAGFFDARGVAPVFNGKSATARIANSELHRAVHHAVQRFVAETRSQVASGERPTLAWSLSISPTPSVSKHNLISGYMAHESYAGGAHGNLDLRPFNFGIANRRPQALQLHDLLTPGRDAIAVADEVVMPRLRAMGAEWVLSGDMKSLGKEYVDRFTITPGGLTWVFSPYATGSYAQGAQIVKVAWDAFPKGAIDRYGALSPLFNL